MFARFCQAKAAPVTVYVLRDLHTGQELARGSHDRMMTLQRNFGLSYVEEVA